MGKADQKPKKDEYTRYLKKPVLEETDIPNPIQGPVKDPNTLFHFMRDLKDSAVPTFIGVFLDDDYLSVGNQILGHHTAEDFKTGLLFKFHYILGGKRFVLMTNHTNGDATPTEADRQLISDLQVKVKVLDEVEFFDYVIVAGDHFWSMTTQDGTACHCGQQHYWEG